MSIIIVGNSKGLLGRGLGKVINSYSVICRFNNYRVEGFEEDVGSKLGWWVVRSCDDIKLQPKNSFEKLFVVQPRCRYFSAMVPVAHRYKLLYGDKFNLIGPEECSEAHRALDLGDFNKEWISVGMAFLWHVLSSYGSVSVVGMDQGNTHYWNHPPKDSCYHNYAKEKVMFDNWVKEGRINLLY